MERLISDSGIVVTGSLLLALWVVLSAFGAHGLKDVLDAYGKEVFEKAALYHAVHALGIVLVGILLKVEMLSAREASILVLTLCGGILFFSGSLYLLALSGLRWLGAITPIGGVLFIASWALLAWFSRTPSS